MKCRVTITRLDRLKLQPPDKSSRKTGGCSSDNCSHVWLHLSSDQIWLFGGQRECRELSQQKLLPPGLCLVALCVRNLEDSLRAPGPPASRDQEEGKDQHREDRHEGQDEEDHDNEGDEGDDEGEGEEEAGDEGPAVGADPACAELPVSSEELDDSVDRAWDEAECEFSLFQVSTEIHLHSFNDNLSRRLSMFYPGEQSAFPVVVLDLDDVIHY